MDRLTRGQRLGVNDELRSANGKVRLVIQEDGDLVLCRTDNGYALWATGTRNKPANHAVMQEDGNFVCYGRDGTVLWASETPGHPGAELILHDDGNLVLHGPGNVAVWASNTAQDWNVRTIAPQHADLGNGHYMVCTADLNVSTDQVKVSGQLTTVNKITGFAAGVAVLFYGENGELLQRQEQKFDVGQAPPVGAAHAPVDWDLQAPAGTAAFALSQFWYPHGPLADVELIEAQARREAVRRIPGWLAMLGRERPRPAWLREWPHAWWLSVGTVCFGAFMGQLDASIVTLTYRPLRREFHAVLAGVQWVSLSYLLALTALLIPVGRLADVRGRKLTYLYGFVVFTVASAACGLAPSLGVLVAFRVVQAAGAAMLQANSVALVATSAPTQRRRAALGVQAAAQAIGLALGPTAGGLLVSTLGWRWVFDLNVPVGLVAVVAGIYLLPRTRQRSPVTGWDLPGTLLLATATTGLLLGISVVSGLALPGWAAIAFFVLSASAAAAFLAHQRRAPAPLIDLTLLRQLRIAAGLLGALGGYLLLFGPLVLVPVILTATGASELHAGLVLTALPAGFALAATGAERLLPRSWSDSVRATLGATLVLGVLGGLTLAPLLTPELIALLGLLGLALGVFIPANNSLVMSAIPTRAAATGGGLVSMARSLGTALGVALVTLMLSIGPVLSIGSGHVIDGPRAAVLVLAVTATVALAATRRMSSRSGGTGAQCPS